MSTPKEERRKYERYDTELEIYFQVTFDLETKVKYEIIDKEKEVPLSKKYSAISKNVSAKGLAFFSGKKLDVGEALHLEVYLPSADNPIHMQGEVRWCEAPASEEETRFETGVELMSVSGQSVVETISYDETNHVIWSVVLESVFGHFKDIAGKRKKP